MKPLRLTPREREIVEAIQEGESYKAVAASLGVEPGTVGAYVHRIAQRLPGRGSPLRKILSLQLSESACVA